jgi:hypothetical protein
VANINKIKSVRGLPVRRVAFIYRGIRPCSAWDCKARRVTRLDLNRKPGEGRLGAKPVRQALPVLRLSKDDRAGFDSPAPRSDLIDITSPAPSAQEGIRPRARRGSEEGASERVFLAGELALPSYALARK